MSRLRDSKVVLAIACAGVLFFCSAAIVVFQLWQAGPQSTVRYGVALGVPFAATGFFLGTCVLVPNVLAVGKLRFPLNITLPLIFAALVLLVVTLWTSTGNSLVAGPEILRTAKIWLSPSLLAEMVLFQGALLSLIILFRADANSQR